MIISTKRYFKHSYFNGVVLIFKMGLVKFFGLFRPFGQFDKIREAFAAKGVKFYYPVLERMDSETLKCVSCGVCEKICPTKCIEIKQSKGLQIQSSELSFGQAPDDFLINLRECIQCGLCQEVCPVDAISVSGTYNLLNHDAKMWNQSELKQQSKPPKEEF